MKRRFTAVVICLFAMMAITDNANATPTSLPIQALQPWITPTAGSYAGYRLYVYDFVPLNNVQVTWTASNGAVVRQRALFAGGKEHIDYVIVRWNVAGPQTLTATVTYNGGSFVVTKSVLVLP